MPIRASDTAHNIVYDVSTYPREIDFPLQRNNFLHSLGIDRVNISDDLMWSYKSMICKIGDADTIIKCSYTSNADIHRGIITNQWLMVCATAGKNDGSYISNSVYRRHASVGVDNFIDGMLHIVGAPYYLDMQTSVILEDRSQLSCVVTTVRAALAVLPGWTRTEITRDEVCICLLEDVHEPKVHDWVINNADFFIRMLIRSHILSKDPQVYKVTDNMTGRGYVEFVY